MEGLTQNQINLMIDIERVKINLSNIYITFSLTFCEEGRQNFNKQKLFYLRDFRGTLTTRRTNKMKVTTAGACSLHFQALITIQNLQSFNFLYDFYLLL